MFPVLLSGFLALAGEAPTASAVRAELIISPAETYVIGDTVPLFWRFHNTTREPLAFMWEGCCRLNGRLTVTQADRPLEPIPPGQALAHMFAKAERLEPGQGRDFDTRLGDWVRLTNSGSYRLQGRYTGVLPDQHPQVPKGTALWRDAAATGPIEVGLLTVDDYLAERAGRAERRGLKLELTGPAALPPLKPAPFQVTVHNTGLATNRLGWPDAVRLWIVDRHGERVALASAGVEGQYEEVALAPGAALTRAIAFSSDQLEGEPLGDYRVFLDLAAGETGQPRVPSNVLPLRWQLSDAAVAELVAAAAAGHRTGARNAPLKLLRVYVAELGPALDKVAGDAAVPPAVQALAKQLRLASILKPLAPKPGRVDWTLVVDSAGRLTFRDPPLAAAAAGQGEGLADQLAALLAVRRHLGCEVGVRLEPLPTVTIGRLLAGVGELSGLRTNLVTVPFFSLQEPNATNRISLGTLSFSGGGSAPVVLHLGNDGRLSGARRADPARPLSRAEIDVLPPVPDASLAAGASRLVLVARPEASWDEVLAVAQPILERGGQIDLRLPPP